MALYQHRFSGHTAENETWMFTWWATSTRTIDQAQAAAVDWLNAVWTSAPAGNGYGDHVVAAVGADNVTTVDVTAATGLQTARRDTAVALVGAAAGNPLPADCAVVVSLRTATANRSGRGRFYLPQPAVSQVTSAGRVLADLITDTIAVLDTAWAAYNTALDVPVVYSRTQRLTRPITSYDIGNLYDTQRRRETKLLEVRTTQAMPA